MPTAFRVILLVRKVYAGSHPPEVRFGSSRGSLLPKEQMRVGSGNGQNGNRKDRRRDGYPERTEQMLDGVLAYRGRWVYCVQRGAATGRERRLMHLGGRTESEDPRGRTDESPPGGM
jgi:hypothetical protein